MKINCIPRAITPAEIELFAVALVNETNEVTNNANAAMKVLAKKVGSEKPLHFHRDEDDEIEDYVNNKLNTALVIELPDHDYNLVHRLNVDYSPSKEAQDKGKVDIMSETYAISKDWKVAVDVTQFAELGGGIAEMSVIGNSLAEVFKRKDEYIDRDMAKCKEINSKKQKGHGN